jgi:hypothetical protein
MRKDKPVKHKYFIILYLNGKKKKLVHKSARRSTIMEHWSELKTQKIPPYCAEIRGRKRTKLEFELFLIYPKTRWNTTDKAYKKDELGRHIEVSLDSEKFRVKEIIPWFEEERVYDFQVKEHIRFHEMMDKIYPIEDICHIFTLNNKLFVQVENDVHVYGNKNLHDTARLFDLVIDSINKKKRKNFLFVKDVTTYQRKQLYDFLITKGFSRRELFRHYSY